LPISQCHVIVECLQTNWHSAVYGFFQAKVSVGHDEGHKYHFFKCASVKCKGKGQKGVRHYLDLKDHAVKCFGQDAVKATFKKTQSGGRDVSIFTVFAHQGQQPVKISHRTHITEESRWVLDSYFECSHLRNNRAHIVRWCAKNNCPHRIIKDCQFEILMKAGQPGTSLPSPITVSCNIKAAFEHCRECIDKGKTSDWYHGLFVQSLHRNTLGVYTL